MDRIITFFQRKRAVSLILIFAAFMLIQLVILRLGNKAGRGFIMPEHQELVYYGMQLPVILGFVLRRHDGALSRLHRRLRILLYVMFCGR